MRAAVRVGEGERRAVEADGEGAVLVRVEIAARGMNWIEVSGAE